MGAVKSGFKGTFGVILAIIVMIMVLCVILAGCIGLFATVGSNQ